MQQTIKSFVIRAGRVSKRQQFALDNLLEPYLLAIDGRTWDFQAIFNRVSNTVIEIGFGMGASLIAMAKQNPQTNFIGIEVHRAGVGSLVADLHDNDINNVRVAMYDAVFVLEQQIKADSLQGVQIFFPDPWHKKRHHKRRLIQPNFVKLVAERLKPGGFLHCATDWQDYAESMQEVLSAESTLENSQPQGGFAPRPSQRPITKFELRGNRLGHGVWDLIYLKKNS
ncbi:tRNA (m7G46) methyltransferase, SAM-dependent [Legionella beliardensis]|uniref:tRNA (guanine-N(7)-)-methyltransferase n=1 Tax=Legionella beliardensis TaxID=91822 RepID=A0A378I0E0_9GAMM|nr:tRNA (guanosine(46)-N7)-methyltransferase TrmB [Legionella beliardensis]STX28046.1 tRNA (m7G46) methyltransferase, SAM-dependent [Legionella beliardensis]